jgi:phage terminase large subunit
LKFHLSPKQTLALDTLNDPAIRYVLYGGAKGGGKSVFGCMWVLVNCLDIINRFQLMPRKYPTTVAFMGRKHSVDFNDTTLETWKKIIPEQYYTIRSSDKEIIIRDTVKILYGGFDSEDQVKKFNSAEFGFFFIDQAEEITQDDIALLKGTLRLKVKDTPLDYKGLLTANPAPCWLKDEFITSAKEGNAFIRALPSDNPFLPESYIHTLEEAFQHRPELLEAYLKGSWDLLAGSDLVIKPSWVDDAVGRELPVNYKRRLISCDPARFGNDETVIYVFEETKVIQQMIYGNTSTMETAGHLMRLKNEYMADKIFVESGMGGGIIDRLREIGCKDVIEVNMASKPTTEIKELKFINRRAEIIWEAGEMFFRKEVCLHDDRTLRSQLTNIKYKQASRGRIQIESKSDIKARTSGKSPDRADAYVLGLHGLQFVEKKEHDFGRMDMPIIDDMADDAYGWKHWHRQNYGVGVNNYGY